MKKQINNEKIEQKNKIKNNKVKKQNKKIQ